MSQSLKCEYNKELFANVELLFVDMCVHIDSVKIFKYRSNYLSSLLVVKFPVACFSFRGSMSDKKSHMVCIFPRKMLKPWFLKKKKNYKMTWALFPWQQLLLKESWQVWTESFQGCLGYFFSPLLQRTLERDTLSTQRDNSYNMPGKITPTIKNSY